MTRSLSKLANWPLGAVICVLLVSGSLSADGLQRVRVRLVNGSSIRGTIDSIDSSGSMVGSENLSSRSISDLTTILTGKPIEELSANRTRLDLKFGGRILCSEVEIQDDQIKTTSGELKRDVPTEIADSIVWRETEKVSEALQNRSRQFDSVVVASRKGEVVVNGLIESINATHVLLDYNGKSRKITRDKVMAVVFAALDVPRPERAFAKAYLVDGTVLCGEVREYQKGRLTIGVSESFGFVVDVSQLARVDIQSKSVVYLSDLEPLTYEQQSQFALPRKWQRDKSLMGNPIQLKFSSSGRLIDFDKGIGTRSYTNLVFENSDSFSHFRAVVGIDAQTGGQGDCEMVVEGDGIRLWSKRVTGKSDPEPLAIPIDGINKLSLIVLPGENFDLADHAVWADAKLTKTP